MKTILITGGCGFIGRAIANKLKFKHRIIVFDKKQDHKDGTGVIFVKGDICQYHLVSEICEKYPPQIVLHCAGLSSQKIASPVDTEFFKTINCLATIELAKAAAQANPEVHFVYFSSISVYGDIYTDCSINESLPCCPRTSYAKSKYDAEIGLNKLHNEGMLKQVDILRLAPVYDVLNSLNIEKRIFGPGRFLYFKYGTGNQKISVLCLQNLVEFIEFRTDHSLSRQYYSIFNVSDKTPYSFNEMIQIFKQSKYQPDRITLQIPLIFVRIICKLLSFVFDNSEWLKTSYKKLSSDSIVDIQKLLSTGFNPEHTLEKRFHR